MNEERINELALIRDWIVSFFFFYCEKMKMILKLFGRFFLHDVIKYKMKAKLYMVNKNNMARVCLLISVIESSY